MTLTTKLRHLQALGIAVSLGLPAGLLAVGGAAGAAEAAAEPALHAVRNAAPNASCLRQAQALVRDADVVPDLPLRERLQAVPAELAAALRERGQTLGPLDARSLISPPSRYELVQLPVPGGTAAAATESCPLHQLYIAFRQGGFVPQPVVYYGPLRAAAAAEPAQRS